MDGISPHSTGLCPPGLYKIFCCLRAKCRTGLVPTIFKVVWAWLYLILSFFPFFFFLSSLFLFFFHFYSLSLLSPIFSFFFLSPPYLQNGVGAYKHRLLAHTLCRALPESNIKQFHPCLVISFKANFTYFLCNRGLTYVHPEQLQYKLFKEQSWRVVRSQKYKSECRCELSWVAVGMKDTIGVVDVGAISFWSGASQARGGQSALLDPRQKRLNSRVDSRVAHSSATPAPTAKLH